MSRAISVLLIIMCADRAPHTLGSVSVAARAGGGSDACRGTAHTVGGRTERCTEANFIGVSSRRPNDVVNLYAHPYTSCLHLQSVFDLSIHPPSDRRVQVLTIGLATGMRASCSSSCTRIPNPAKPQATAPPI